MAGVGEVLGKRLKGKGFDQANVVLGQFLLLQKNKDLFTEWMKVSSLRTGRHMYRMLQDLVNANTKQPADCHQSLADW